MKANADRYKSGERDEPQGRECDRLLSMDRGLGHSVSDQCGITKLFEVQVRHTPSAVAVICGDLRLSYNELNCAANLLANELIEAGAAVGEYIPVLMSRSVEMIVSQLAILKAGGVYVPIDPELPAQRQELIVKDCGARTVLALPGNKLSTNLPKVHLVETTNLRASGRSSMENIERKRPSASAAYVMYTSGSTGTPKGVIVPHRGVIRLAINNGYADIEQSDRIGHCSNPSFDAATFEIWGALLNGATVVVVPQCVLLSKTSFSKLVKTELTTLFLTTTLFNQYALTSPEMFANLKYLLFGGEAADPNCVREVMVRGHPSHLLNVYGPTETTTFASFWPVTSIPEGTISLPVGRPISDTQIYVLNDQLQQVPRQTLGEVYIGGAGVALGYLNRPELTAKAFVHDPFTAQPGALLYKTGDLGRWNADGLLELKGRVDFQVKIRGFRVELEEVEGALRSYPGIHHAAALVREQATGAKSLVGYVVPTIPVVTENSPFPQPPVSERIGEKGAHAGEGRGPAPALQLSVRIRDFLNAKLPHYMVPDFIVVLEEIPLTSSGKIDRSALPPPRGRTTSSPYVAPQTSVETTLCEIWRMVLAVDEIGVEDHFLELGGTSILAMKIGAAVDDAFGLEFPVSVIYRRPTVRTLAEFIKDALS